MTTAAWITLGLTWTVVGYFSARFFLQVLHTPVEEEKGPE